ncbi:pyridoxamine 5'-phosphate oxidase family protein [uncultured Tateyamaria sp.]|uniref:FAD-binding oxidoreductase n=1 Tax=uncultured Tateyamaria sp. TaxID=455651 RepID=UPI002620478C|nr:pyridoxamine 5'-phosphate oxidase family protein [uncultured Tateyamaria sp.]
MAHATTDTPFHDGERTAQIRAGVGNVAEWAGGFVRDHLPEQHREFHTSLPFLVLAGADTHGHTWVTLVQGDEGFIQSPDTRTLTLDTHIDDDDPLALALTGGTTIGAVGIELASRRRNRFSGDTRKTDTGFAIDIRQTFGNCPQYIHQRAWTRVTEHAPQPARRTDVLDEAQIARIRAADTLFIGSGHQEGNDVPSRGFDASHRGGAPGFVQVIDGTHLHIPDYSGNNFFNTIGNLITDARVGLVFVDFETGGLLHVSGRATIDWDPDVTRDPDARRMIEVEIDAIVDRPAALSLRWAPQDHLTRQLKVTARVQEAQDITSFYFSPVDGAPLSDFKAGQHLPIQVQIPGQVGLSKRSYSLSMASNPSEAWRLSIKREEQGLVSRFFHDHLQTGDVIEASPPGGEFTVPDGDGPLVLVSAGVGITPMMAMMQEVAAQGSHRTVWFVHAARNGAAHAFVKDVRALVDTHPNLHRHVVYSQPDATDVAGKDYDAAGRLTSKDVAALGGVGADAHYMLCGPARFLSDMRTGLEAAGVQAAHIHFETFGPSAPA